MILKSKIIIIIAIATLLTVGTTTGILLKFQSTKMIDTKMEDTEFLGDIIERSVSAAMIENETHQVQKIIENIGKNSEILTLQILAPDGTILKSKNRDEIGTKADELIPFSNRGDFKKTELADNSTIHFIKRIRNRQECFGCHASTEPYIGIISIRQDVSRNFSAMLSLKRVLVISNIAIVLVISVVLSFIFSHFVIRPLKNLLGTIRDVESGNLQATASISGDDEMGTIGSAFNRMIQEIRSLHAKSIAKEREITRIRGDLEHKGKLENLNMQLELKIRELETANRAISSLSREVKGKNIELEKSVEHLKKINEIGRMLSSIVEIEELKRIIVRTTADLMRARKVVLHLRQAQKPDVAIRFIHGAGIENLASPEDVPFPADSSLMHHGKPFFVTADATDEGTPMALRDTVCSPLILKGKVIGTMLLEGKTDSSHFTESELELLTVISHQTLVSVENAWLYERLKSNYFSTIQSLVAALEANDRYTSGHSDRVRILSLELGKYVGLDFRELETLEHASILHDIGKIGIDNVILQKQGKLTNREYKLIQTHPQIGNEILGPIGTLEDVRQIILQHHERYDGRGYPFGLKGEEISLKSRILSVVDTFDAMMTERPYRKAFALDKVHEELLANVGTQFDPHVVNAFLEMINERGEQYLQSIGYTHTLQAAFQ